MSGDRRPEPSLRALRPGLVLVETHMEGFDVRSAVISGADRTVLFDTLAHPRDMAPVRALVRKVPVTVIYSHADWDHAWGTCGLDRWDDVVAHEAAAERFRGDVLLELSRRRKAHPEAWDAVRLVPPTATVRAAAELDLGGVTLALSPLPGHTPDSLVGFVPEWGVLLAGDAVEAPLPVVNDGSAAAGWAEALDAWSADARVVTVVPAHGEVGGPELIRATARYLRSILAGREPLLPDGLEPFYREVHLANRERMRLAEAPVRPHVGSLPIQDDAGDSAVER